MSATKVLSICIPTYNRSGYLDACLARVFAEVKGQEHLINVLVSDNASTDDTQKIVVKYQNMGLDIKYNRHSKNLGTEKNFLSLYESTDTKYFWLLSDDDYVVPNVLNNILLLIENEDYGLIYLNNKWCDEIPENIEAIIDFQNTIYTDPIDFIRRVNYWITFISGNIINKQSLSLKIKPAEYNGTMLNYLGWYIPALFEGDKNVFIENVCLMCKANNSGGYKIFEVFGKNFNKILDSLIAKGYDSRMKQIINKSLLLNFFPSFLKAENKGFANERYLPVLLPVFWTYKSFWTVIIPKLLKK